MLRMLALLMVLCATAPPAFAHRVVVDGGRVQMRGELVNGACAVAPESQSLRIDMGQYRTNTFAGVGSFSTVTVPFTLKMVDCRTDISRLVGVTFQGLSPAEDPQVFLAATQVSGVPAGSGLGLALFDNKQQMIIPNAPPVTYFPVTTGEMTLYFSARYRVISLPLTPGVITSDVWFTLIYP